MHNCLCIPNSSVQECTLTKERSALACMPQSKPSLLRKIGRIRDLF